MRRLISIDGRMVSSRSILTIEIRCRSLYRRRNDCYSPKIASESKREDRYTVVVEYIKPQWSDFSERIVETVGEGRIVRISPQEKEER